MLYNQFKNPFCLTYSSFYTQIKHVYLLKLCNIDYQHDVFVTHSSECCYQIPKAVQQESNFIPLLVYIFHLLGKFDAEKFLVSLTLNYFSFRLLLWKLLEISNIGHFVPNRFTKKCMVQIQNWLKLMTTKLIFDHNTSDKWMPLYIM